MRESVSAILSPRSYLSLPIFCSATVNVTVSKCEGLTDIPSAAKLYIKAILDKKEHKSQPFSMGCNDALIKFPLLEGLPLPQQLKFEVWVSLPDRSDDILVFTGEDDLLTFLKSKRRSSQIVNIPLNPKSGDVKGRLKVSYVVTKDDGRSAVL